MIQPDTLSSPMQGKNMVFLQKFLPWQKKEITQHRYLLLRTSIWYKSFAILSAILSICFLGRSDIRRILCFLHKNEKSYYRSHQLVHNIRAVGYYLVWTIYLAVAVPRRTANSWYLFSCFNMKGRWLFIPQIMIWSVSRTCICAPSLSLCILLCCEDSIVNLHRNIANGMLNASDLTLNCSVMVLRRRE